MAKAKLESRPITPADWAHIASKGTWRIRPELDLINRKLCQTAAARYQGRGINTLIMMPPQHGKTTIVGHSFPGWWLGYFPDDNIGLIGYEAEFAAKRGRAARDIFEQNAPGVFNLKQDPEISAISHWGVLGHEGTMSTFGAGGGITGSAMNLLLIDDPIKNEEQAYSELFRQNQWEWFTGTVMSRVRAVTSCVMIYTSWHEDDLGQRIILASLAGELEPWDIVRIPALAETQEERDDYASRMGLPIGQPDPIGRQPGACLWPEMWPVEKLLMRKKTNPYQFEAMFQGRPRPKGGLIFNRVNFIKCKASDVPRDAQRCRFWDKAASVKNTSDWTVGVKMARANSGEYYIENVVRERLSPSQRDKKILAVAADDAMANSGVRIRADQDPAQAGKSDAENFCRMLDRYDVKTKVISGDKIVNARPLASAVEGGRVYIVEAPWNAAYLDELESFNKGKHDDQVDASAGAYNSLAEGDQELRVGPNPTAGYTGRRAS